MRIAYDVELLRPGCAVVQAALGGTEGIANRFPVDSWLTAPTDGMRVYEVDADRLDRIVALTERALTEGDR